MFPNVSRTTSLRVVDVHEAVHAPSKMKGLSKITTESFRDGIFRMIAFHA